MKDCPIVALGRGHAAAEELFSVLPECNDLCFCTPKVDAYAYHHTNDIKWRR